MISTPTIESPIAAEISDTYVGKYTPTKYQSEHRPTAKSFRFLYRRKLLPIEGGRVLLRIRKAPRIAVNPDTLLCEVIGWGVKVPHTEIGEIDRVMSRRFLELFSKADAQRLTETEQNEWVQILDQVDFQAFCVDRAAPQYVEGTLLKKHPGLRVEWHDGHSEDLPENLEPVMAALNEMDRFGAFVKWGSGGSVQSLERIVLLVD